MMKNDWSSPFFPSGGGSSNGGGGGYGGMPPMPSTSQSHHHQQQQQQFEMPPANVLQQQQQFYNNVPQNSMMMHSPTGGNQQPIETSPTSTLPSVLKIPKSEQEQQSNGQIKGERCVGCGSDSSIRVHYGASSCHGCKAFFRRSVFEGRQYMCSADNNCDITNESRNRCRACRLRNCLDGGMNPKHVREERSKIERLPPGTSMCTVSANGMTVNSTPSTPASFGNMQSLHHNGMPASVESHGSSGSEAEINDKKPVSTAEALILFMVALERQTEHLTDDDVTYNEAMGAWSRDISLTFGLQHPQTVIKRLPLKYTCERIMEASDIYLSWYRSFVYCADWAMGIPEFRILPLSDQTTLFKQNFMAFGWITFAYKCYKLGQYNHGIPLGNGAYIPYNDIEQKKLPERWAQTYGVVCKKLMDLIVKVMIELQISEEEYCLIKTISLFQLDCILSDVGASICSKVRDKLLESLSFYLEQKFPHYNMTQKTTRALKISLMLPSFSHIGQVESTLIQQLTAADLHQLSGVPMEICAAQQSL